MDTLLYFGSFNPVHNGHTAMAAYVLSEGLCDELWFVVSPRNPLKPAAGLAPDMDRLTMVEIAAKEQLGDMPARVKSDEFLLPKPSYTIYTLRHFEQKYPDRSFSLLVGADIIEQITRWKEYKTLIANYRFLVYPRQGYDARAVELPDMVLLENAPLWECSSTSIREAVRQGDDISGMVSPGVGEFIRSHCLWK